MYIWEPHQPRRRRCVAEAGCCEAYLLCFEGAEFYVLRYTKGGKAEETARGTYEHAYWGAWLDLTLQHEREKHRVAS
ncbi:hypothetical protein BKM31_17555 [[Actinomadura] parvosata subsp. kistnae]|uniref:Uncharacterized protein n=1 Tax=[Actinomadura] parvosata subsp. kistnae TaxID=1909395 RepID=A0A1U9ZYM1_9ACTN|nr:hypothetical protein BKM31_17555 [Nonomuraea sp. ATCC 55076]